MGSTWDPWYGRAKDVHAQRWSISEFPNKNPYPGLDRERKASQSELASWPAWLRSHRRIYSPKTGCRPGTLPFQDRPNLIYRSLS